MEKNIKDYLHLYLGCLYIADYPTNPSSPETLTGKVYEKIIATTSEHLAYNSKYIKPILRRDMSDEENEEYKKLKAFQRATPVHQIMVSVDTPESFRYLLSIGIDLFGLIESGLALDATKIKTA